MTNFSRRGKISVMKSVINVVGAAFVKCGKIFAAKRSYGSEYVIHKYEFVGGKVEPGETKEQALMRECREELGITLSVGDIFMDVLHEYSDITVHLTLFNAVITEGVPQMLEHNDIKWITPDEIPNYEFCPADEEILRRITMNSI